MRRSTGNTPIGCSKCRTPTNEPRRGLCPKCYQAAYNGREKGDACAACTHADPRALVRRRVAGASTPATLCGNCAAILGRRRVTLDELRAELRAAGDRRGLGRRRGYERRTDERRSREGDRRILRAGVGERRRAARRLRLAGEAREPSAELHRGA